MLAIKDIFQDIVKHTHSLGFLELVKLTGVDDHTKIDSIKADNRVIMLGKTNDPFLDEDEVVGIGQLGKLKYLLDCVEYKEDPKIKFTKDVRNGEDIIVAVHFENAQGDFKNDFSFMSKQIINEKIKNASFKTAIKWDVELEPSMQSIQRFVFQAQTNPECLTFLPKVENGKLIFVFGDKSTHNGEFVFANGILGKLTKDHTWPIAEVLAILKISDNNTCKISISDQGALKISLESGLASYDYIIPAIA
jgi:hypothetical protein